MSAEVVHKTIEKKKWVSEEWQLGADAPRPHESLDFCLSIYLFSYYKTFFSALESH